MNVLQITIIDNSTGPDAIILEVDLPNGCYPYNGYATVKMDVAAGTAKTYCKTHFPDIPVNTVYR